MATALDIIKGAMRLVHALEAGSTPQGEDSTDALTTLNDLLEQWANERLMIFQKLNEAFTWTAAQQTRTIGSGGDFSTTRPTRLEDGCFALDSSGAAHPLRLLDSKGYQAITLKTLPGAIPTDIYYSPEFPLGKLYIYPVPAAAITVSVASLKQFTAFALPSTSASLPPGYVRALKYNLAVLMGPEWMGREASPTVQREAVESKAAIKRINTPRPSMSIDPGLRSRFRRGGYNITTDGY